MLTNETSTVSHPCSSCTSDTTQLSRQEKRRKNPASERVKKGLSNLSRHGTAVAVESLKVVKVAADLLNVVNDVLVIGAG
jgi:hypothetical protein